MTQALQAVFKVCWFDASLRQGDASARLGVRQFRSGANSNFSHQLASAAASELRCRHCVYRDFPAFDFMDSNLETKGLERVVSRNSFVFNAPRRGSPAWIR